MKLKTIICWQYRCDFLEKEINRVLEGIPVKDFIDIKFSSTAMLNSLEETDYTYSAMIIYKELNS
jgi:hypothetical protein